MSKQSELAELLRQLSDALQSNTIAEAGELYRQAEALSVAMIPAKAAKPHLMQLVRKYLMQTFGPEILRISTNITGKDLAEYDVAVELQKVIDELTYYEQR